MTPPSMIQQQNLNSGQKIINEDFVISSNWRPRFTKAVLPPEHTQTRENALTPKNAAHQTHLLLRSVKNKTSFLSEAS